MIRRAVLSDLDALVERGLEAASDSEGLALDASVLKEGIKGILTGEQQGYIWVVVEGGIVVATAMVTFEWSDWRNAPVWWLQSVNTALSHRRKGLLRRLYAQIRSEAKAAGACALRLYVDTENTTACQAYEALGMDGDHYRVYEEML
ncbi:GNAT family N-acetyltransferase [bacterium]|nr:GNAT family N-acetyltransferase [bacterium]